MLRSTRGTVRAWEGCVVLEVEALPPATLAEAMAVGNKALGLSKILLETGINTGPVDVKLKSWLVSRLNPVVTTHNAAPSDGSGGIL